MREERVVRIPMRDGIQLVGDIFYPAAPGRYPASLELTPYVKSSPTVTARDTAKDWVAHGYAFLVVDKRGRGDLEGTAELLDVGPDNHSIKLGPKP